MMTLRYTELTPYQMSEETQHILNRFWPQEKIKPVNFESDTYYRTGITGTMSPMAIRLLSIELES